MDAIDKWYTDWAIKAGINAPEQFLDRLRTRAQIIAQCYDIRLGKPFTPPPVEPDAGRDVP